MMQFVEAVVISFINTIIIVALHVIRTRHRQRVKFHGPFAYKLDETGTLTEISADSVPTGVWETLREKILSEARPLQSLMFRKSTHVFFALTIFIVQLIILLMI